MSGVMSPLTIWRTGAGLTAVGISFGAFGAHALKSRLSHLPADAQSRSISSWSTSSQYMIYNGLALLAVSLRAGNPALLSGSSVGRRAGAGLARYAAPLILAGTIGFSGSIVGLVLAREKVGKWLGPVTPLGGMVMIAGYIALML